MPLAAAAVCASRAFARAAVRCRILLAAFAVVAALGPLGFAGALLRPPDRGAVAPVPPAAAGLEGLATPLSILALAIAAALITELLVAIVRLRRIKRAALPLGAAGIRGARIGVSAQVSTPTAIGYLHPAVVVPAGFRARLDRCEWDAVIAHECAHLARRDDWAKALQSLVLRACWWLPGLWVLARRLDLEREVASDERAALGSGRRRYAACLLRLATNDGVDALAPAFWGRRSQVALRVERLLQPPAGRPATVRAAVLGAFSAAVMAAISLAVLAIPSPVRPGPPAPSVPLRLAVTRAAGAAARALPKSPPQRATRRAETRLTASARVPAARALAPAPADRTIDGPARLAQQVAPAAAARAPALAPALAPAAPPSAAPARRAAAPTSRAPQLLAYAHPRVRCEVCFGPAVSPDGGYAPSAAQSVSRPAALGAAGSALAETPADDAAGASDLSSRIFLIRIPHDVVLP